MARPVKERVREHRARKKARMEKERMEKEREENQLIGDFIEAVGPGRLRFSLLPVDDPDPDLKDPFMVRLYFPDDEARLATVKFAESRGMDVDTLIDRVLHRGMKTFLGRENIYPVE